MLVVLDRRQEQWRPRPGYLPPQRVEAIGPRKSRHVERDSRRLWACGLEGPCDAPEHRNLWILIAYPGLSYILNRITPAPHHVAVQLLLEITDIAARQFKR